MKNAYGRLCEHILAFTHTQMLLTPPKSKQKWEKYTNMRCAFNLSSCSFSDIEFQTVSQKPTGSMYLYTFICMFTTRTHVIYWNLIFYYKSIWKLCEALEAHLDNGKFIWFKVGRRHGLCENSLHWNFSK